MLLVERVNADILNSNGATPLHMTRDPSIIQVSVFNIVNTYVYTHVHNQSHLFLKWQALRAHKNGRLEEERVTP